MKYSLIAGHENVQFNGCGQRLASELVAENRRLLQDGESGAAVPSGRRELNRWHSGSCISEGQAAVELFYRLNHARQTVDYVRRQVRCCPSSPGCPPAGSWEFSFTCLAILFFQSTHIAPRAIACRSDMLMNLPVYLVLIAAEAPYCWGGQAAMYARLDRAEMGIWEALELLGTLREYETALLEEDGTNADLPLPEHAARTAEACRAAFPDLDWLHLVGLIHSLGKIIAHKR